VACLSDAQRGFDRLEVAHFADEYDIGILAESGPESFGEAPRVRVDFALVDQATLVIVQKLNRVFDG
jgi:hypothetical protein